MKPTPLGKKTYEEYEKELKEFNLSKVERVELGSIDDLKKSNSEGKEVAKNNFIDCKHYFYNDSIKDSNRVKEQR